MKNSYLKKFNDLFFNVEDHDNVKETIEQTNYVLDLVITRFGEMQNEISTESSENDDFVDTVIILFIRKIMEQLDAVNVLYSVCLFESAQIILRSLIESIVSLLFILKKDTKKRAAAYYLEHHYQELDKSKIYFKKDSEFVKQIISQKGKDMFDKDCIKLEKKKQAFKRILNSKKVFQEIDIARKKKLEAKKKVSKKGNVYIQWYEICSTRTTFYGVMKEMGYEKYYESIYGGLSFESHGLNATMGISANVNGLFLKLIRNPKCGATTFELACDFSIIAMHRIYCYLGYEKSEMAKFKDFYKKIVENRNIASHNLEMLQIIPDSGFKESEDV